MKASSILALCLASLIPTVQGKELSVHSVNIVIQAQEYAEKGELTSAIKLLKNSDTKRAYDTAYLQRTLAVYLWQKGESKAAIKALESALASKQLDDSMNWAARRMLADLYVSQEQYAAALKFYREMISSPISDEPLAPIWLRIAQVNYQQQQWASLLSAITAYEAADGDVSITSLNLKLNAELQLHQLTSALFTVGRLIKLAPMKRNFWLQKVSIQLQLNQPEKALATLQLAELQQVNLERSDWLMMAHLYAQNALPERAARILAKLDLSEDLVLQQQLASYWQQAKQWPEAIEAWRIIAKQDPRVFWQIALLQIQLGQYQQALNSLTKLPQSHKPGQAALARTNAFYQLGDNANALKQAQLAHNIDGSDESAQWVEFLSQRLAEK